MFRTRGFVFRKTVLYTVMVSYVLQVWAGWLSRYSDWLRAGRSGIESRWGRDFSPVQTGPGAHPASCKMGTGSSTGVKWRGHGRVELYLYTPSGPHRACNRITLPLPLRFTCIVISSLIGRRLFFCLLDCLYWCMKNVLYSTCMYSRLREDEPSSSKHVEAIKKLKIKIWIYKMFISFFDVSIIRSSSGSILCSLLKLQFKILKWFTSLC